MTYHARIVTTLGVMAALLLTLAAAAIAAPVSSTVLVDRPTGFGPLPFDGVSGASVGVHALSAEGRYVVFSSSNDVLLAGDEDTAENVYRLDRSNGALAQVNVTASGGQPTVGSFGEAASISADGRYVEFESDAGNLVPGAPGKGFYVKDMQTGVVELASRATGADGGAASSPGFAVISGDGRHVAFTATGPLHAENANGAKDATDAYVRALDAGTTHMVSVTSAGAEVGGVTDRAAPDIDFNGDAVAFITDAKLNADDADDTDDAYVRLEIGAQVEMTRLVSFTSRQTPGADTAAEVALSGEGSVVAWSNGFNSVGGELGRSIFMASLLPSVGPARQLDVSRPGGFGSGGGNPAFEPVSGATRFPVLLYFRSDAALSGTDTNDSADLYAAEIAHPGDGNFVHLESSGKANGALTAGAGAQGGAVVAFGSAASSLPGADGARGEVYVRAAGAEVNVSQPAGVAPRTSPAGSSFSRSVHAVSDDGRKVIFQAEAPAFGSVPTSREDLRGQVVVRDLVSGQTALVSAASDGSPANDFASQASLDAAGRHAAFVSEATNLVGDPNPDHILHAYVRDLATGAVALVDRTAAGAPLADGVGEATISPDGRHVVYTSRSVDAPGTPANDTAGHVYVVDLATGRTVLADRAGDGTPGNASAFNADISDDGSRVAFESSATNLGAGPSPSPQLYVRDLAKNTTTWASVPEDANPAHADPGDLSLSHDGTRVAFEQFSRQFGFGMSAGAQVFVRDLAARTTTLASRTPSGAVADSAEQPSLSADGSRVSFTTSFDQLPLIPQVYVRDLSAGTTTLVSAAGNGGPARLGGFDPSLSGNGACVAFNSSSDDIVSPTYGTDYFHVFLRGVGAGCAVGFSDTGAGPGGTGGGTIGGTGGGPQPDKTPPRISGARLTHARFAVAGARTAIIAGAQPSLRHVNAPRGTRFVFSLSERARTTIVITREAGRRPGGRCVILRPGLKHPCTRTVAVLTLMRGSTLGPNSVRFSGRAGRTTLTPGRYVAQIVALDDAGNRSKPVALRFTVVSR